MCSSTRAWHLLDSSGLRLTPARHPLRPWRIHKLLCRPTVQDGQLKTINLPVFASSVSPSVFGDVRSKRDNCVTPLNYSSKRMTHSVSFTSDLTIEQIQHQIDSLEGKCKKYCDAYYNGNSLISDDAYDSLVAKLEKLKLQLQSTTGIPNNVPSPVGAPPSSPTAQKVRHLIPMLSLADVRTREQLGAWHEGLLRTLAREGVNVETGRDDKLRWVVEPKVDGLAVRIWYKDGKLVQAATRGDGVVGEDVTTNALMIQDLPHQMNQSGVGAGALRGLLEVRGEVYINKQDFAELNQEQRQSGAEEFANARNTASGSLRLHDSGESRRRRLRFLAYQLLAINEQGGLRYGKEAPGLPKSQWEVLSWLRARGFAVADGDLFHAKSFVEAVAAAEAWMARRSSLAYEVDGAVLKLDSLELQEKLGASGGDPRWAVAWKFPASEAITRLKAVTWNVTRNGQLVPLAHLDPVNLLGATIRKATLHNLGHLKQLGAQLGDHVVVRRSGDVIPQIMSVALDLRSGEEAPWELPSECPSCGGPLVLQSGSMTEVLMCTNKACGAQATQSLVQFANQCLPVVGEGKVRQLMGAGLLASLPDFYSLERDQLRSLPGWGEKSADITLDAISRSKELPLEVFLTGLGIRYVGQLTAKLLALHFSSLKSLCEATEQDLTSIKGVGQVTAQAISQWARSSKTQELLKKLEMAGVACVGGAPQGRDTVTPSSGPAAMGVTSPVAPSGSKTPPLAGMKVAITGTLVDKAMSRREFESWLKAQGAELAKSVTRSTQILVLTEGSPGGNKLEAAGKLGVPVMKETDFWRAYEESHEEVNIGASGPTYAEQTELESPNTMNGSQAVEGTEVAITGAHEEVNIGASGPTYAEQTESESLPTMMNGSQPLEGMKVAITGTLVERQMTRNEFQQWLEAHGAGLAKAVTSTTDLLVCTSGSPGRRKLQDASKFGVFIISEADFWGLYGDE